MEKLLDSHCHLNIKELREDLNGVMNRARMVDVERMLTVCTRFDEIDQIIDIAEKYDNVYYSVGAHPCCALEHLEKYDIEEFLLKYKDAVAVGEIGIDLYRNNESLKGQRDYLDRQMECFHRQIEAAIIMKKPIIVHSRDAKEETLAVLNKYKGRLSGVMHCFIGDEDFARRILDLGFYISFSGVLTYKKNQELRDVAKFVPLENLLVETDAPFLAPQSQRRKVCEPSFIVETTAALAREKGVDINTLLKQINTNFNNLFTVWS